MLTQPKEALRNDVANSFFLSIKVSNHSAATNNPIPKGTVRINPIIVTPCIQISLYTFVNMCMNCTYSTRLVLNMYKDEKLTIRHRINRASNKPN